MQARKWPFLVSFCYAKCHHLKKVTCKRTLWQGFICLRPMTPQTLLTHCICASYFQTYWASKQTRYIVACTGKIWLKNIYTFALLLRPGNLVRCGPGALTYAPEVGRESSDPCAREVTEAHHLRPLRATGQPGKIVVQVLSFSAYMGTEMLRYYCRAK
jgi:hypothetical protein